MKKAKRKRTIKLLTAGAFGAVIGCLTAGTILTISFAKYRSNEKEINDYFETKDLVDKYYLWDTDSSEFMNYSLKGLIAGLGDPYASYMTPEEYSKQTEKLNGSLTGIGVTVQYSEEYGYVIVEIAPDSPAEKAGIEKGDVIYKVNDIPTENMEFESLIGMVKGEEGTSVKITIKRDNIEKECELIREEIKSITVKYEMLENHTAYIKISSFKEITVEQYLYALKDALENGAESIIFDLRGNGGGLLKACEQCLDPLLPEGDIATAEYKDGTTQVICHSDAAEMDIPIAVLIDNNTASASELFCSALRDYGKAKLVGTKTFGKGIMQNTIPLSNGGALKITVAKYKTAFSDCFHGIGLEPDYYTELPEGTDISSPDPENDPQLKKAMLILGG